MKSTTSLILFATMCVCCDSKLPVESEPESFSGVAFSVGNEYNIRHMVGSIPGAVADWYDITSIVRDTVLEQQTFYLFSSGEILRSTPDSVIWWNGTHQACWYRFNVAPGMMVPFQSYQLVVLSVSVDSVFGEPQKIIDLSNSATAVDTVIVARYSTKFGMLFVYKTLSPKIWRTSLAGAKLDTTSYGFMF